MNIEDQSMKKLFFLLIGFSSILFGSLIFIENLLLKNNTQIISLNNTVNKIKERKLVIKDFLQNAKDHLTTLRNSQAFKAFLTHNNHTTKVDEVFFTFALANSSFMQISFIDALGIEKIKVIKKQKNTTPYIVPQNELQNKANRYYYLLSKEKPLEKVWFSPIDLSEENGIIEIPYKPTMKAILPIEKNGNFHGILMVSFFMKNFLTQLNNTPLYDMILYDDKGYTISHYDENKSWGSFQKNKINISQEFPNEFKQILTNNSLNNDKFVSRKLNSEITNGLNIILQLKKQYIQKQQNNRFNRYLTSASIIIVLSLILATFIVKMLSKTLLNLENIKKLNTSLRKLKLKNELALKNSTIGVWELNFETKALTFDEQMYNIYGLTKNHKEEPYSIWQTTLDKDIVEEVEQNLQNAIENNGEYDISFWVTTYKGERKYIKAFGVNELDENGKALRMIGTNQDITKQIQNEALLIEKTNEQNILLSLFDKSDSVLIKWDNKEGWPINYVSDSVEKLFHYTKEEWMSKQISYKECIHEEDLERIISELKKGAARKIPFIKHQPYRIITKTGAIKWIHDQTVFNIDKNGDVVQLIGYVSDITQLKENELSLQKSNNKLQAVFNTALEGISILDSKTKHLEANKQYTKLLGYSEEELKKLTCIEITAPQYQQDIKDIFKQVAKEGYYQNFERDCVTKNQEIRRFRSSIALMPNSNHFLITTVDITDTYNAFKLIEKQSYTDELTQLGNRKSYNQKIDDLYSQFQRYNIIFSLVILDIDFFKLINDTYGHSKGDSVLMKLSTILQSTIRASDYTFRIGGEEFIILLPNTNKYNATIFAENLRKNVENNLSTTGNEPITISIGIAQINELDTVDTIFKRADKNLYHAKNSGRNQVTSHI